MAALMSLAASGYTHSVDSLDLKPDSPVSVTITDTTTTSSDAKKLLPVSTAPTTTPPMTVTVPDLAAAFLSLIRLASNPITTTTTPIDVKPALPPSTALRNHKVDLISLTASAFNVRPPTASLISTKPEDRKPMPFVVGPARRSPRPSTATTATNTVPRSSPLRRSHFPFRSREDLASSSDSLSPSASAKALIREKERLKRESEERKRKEEEARRERERVERERKLAREESLRRS
ncbi:hypothetical protein HK101_005851, partial [Irineochytrium annulatum]